MATPLRRAAPLYIQIVDRFRREIRDGVREPGSRLPTIAEIAREYGVANATAAKAIGQLQAEGLVETRASQGTFVADPRATSSPYDRLRRIRVEGRSLSQGESLVLTGVGVVDPPAYVVKLLDLGAERVIRREWVIYERGRPSMLNVSWYHPQVARDLVPELLSTESASIERIDQSIERRVAYVSDYIEARSCDEREADHLRLYVGTPVLACTYMRYDEHGGVVEYGECVMPPKRVITYDYDWHGRL